MHFPSFSLLFFSFNRGEKGNVSARLLFIYVSLLSFFNDFCSALRFEVQAFLMLWLVVWPLAIDFIFPHHLVSIVSLFHISLCNRCRKNH